MVPLFATNHQYSTMLNLEIHGTPLRNEELVSLGLLPLKLDLLLLLQQKYYDLSTLTWTLQIDISQQTPSSFTATPVPMRTPYPIGPSWDKARSCTNFVEIKLWVASQSIRDITSCCPILSLTFMVFEVDKPTTELRIHPWLYRNISKGSFQIHCCLPKPTRLVPLSSY